jgi:sulfur carrier protein
MKIIFPDRTCRETSAAAMTVEALLRDLGINPLEVLISRNGTLVTEDAMVDDNDEIRIIRIAHGG